MSARNYADFLEWQRGGIGSSSAPAIVSASRWDTPLSIWEFLTEKRGPKEQTFPMARGLAVEPVARRCHEEKLGVVLRIDRAKHPDHDFIRANFDGINVVREHLTELKAPGIRSHLSAMRGIIPDGYEWQLTHQMAVMDYDQMFYSSLYSWKFIPDEFDVTKVRPSSFMKVFKSWDRIPKESIWRPKFLHHISREESIFDFEELANLSNNNCVDLIVYRNKKMEEFLLEAELVFWEKYVMRDVPPPKDFMKKRPNLKLVTEPVTPFKTRQTPTAPSKHQRILARVNREKQRAQAIQKAKSLPVVGDPVDDRRPQTYTADEVVRILEAAKEAGLTELRLPGAEFRFDRRR